jgi:hypothetical protein
MKHVIFLILVIFCIKITKANPVDIETAKQIAVNVIQNKGGKNNDDDYFHFNFGWGGRDDGYRYIDNINTVTGSYNKYQSMITDIKPENEYDCNNEIVVFQWYKHSIPDLFYEPAAGAIYTDISEGILIENGDNVVYSAYNSVKLKNFRVKSGATFKAKLISCPSDCRHASSDAGKDMKNNVVKTANELYNPNNTITIYPNPANEILSTKPLHHKLPARNLFCKPQRKSIHPNT